MTLRVVLGLGDEWRIPVARRGELDAAGVDYWTDEEWCVFGSSELRKLVERSATPVVLSRGT